MSVQDLSNPTECGPDGGTAFLDALYHHARPDAWVTLSTPHPDKEGWPSKWFRVSDAAGIVRAAVAATAAGRHAYISIGAGQKVGRRHNADTIDTLGTLWIEIDMVAAGHHKAADGDLAPDADAALALLEQFPVPPSVIVHTGGGIQAYWFLTAALEGDDIRKSLALWKSHWRGISGSCPWPAAIGVETIDPARVYRLPGSRNVKTAPTKPVQILQMEPGRRYDLGEILSECANSIPLDSHSAAVASQRSPLGDAAHARLATARLQGVLQAVRQSPDGQRNAYGNWGAYLCGRLVAAPWARPHLPDRSAISMEWLAAIRSVESDASDSRLLKIFESGFEAGLLRPCPLPVSRSLQGAPVLAHVRPTADQPPHATPGRYETTDLGNAGRLVELYGDQLRFCTDQRLWLVWDGTRWQRDSALDSQKLAKRTAAGIYAEAAALAEVSSDEASKLAKWARTSGSLQRVNAMLALARDDLAVSTGELDADRGLLNTPTGTLDLSTGELRPHNPDDLITYSTATEFDRDADLAGEGAQLWRCFLDQATGGDSEFIGYLQRAVGYSLGGEPAEDCLFMIYGPGGTGKSTLLEAIASALGDYSTTIDSSALLAKRDVATNQPEIAKLPGRRFVTCEEIDRGRKLAEGLVKNLTGGGTISAQAKYSNPIEFRPQCTIWIATNDRPSVRDDDSGIWRRIRVIPFDRVVPKCQIDPQLRQKLREVAGPAILAWAVRGHEMYLAEGIGTCSRVTLATDDYRDSEDPLSDWLTDSCLLQATARAGLSELWNSYLAWHRSSADGSPLRKREWTARLESLGLARNRESSRRFWAGIGLLESRGDEMTEMTTVFEKSPTRSAEEPEFGNLSSILSSAANQHPETPDAAWAFGNSVAPENSSWGDTRTAIKSNVHVSSPAA
jgi:putative DNA primase/helicase